MRLTEDEVKAKKKYHSKRYDFYNQKLKDIKSKKNRIGFKHYD